MFYIFLNWINQIIINMKKLLISIGSLLIMSFVIVLFINATESDKNPKKTKADVKKETVVTPCSAACTHSGDKSATCDPEKCKELNCDHKDGKCDPAMCEAHKDGKTCSQSTGGCKGTCHEGVK